MSIFRGPGILLNPVTAQQPVHLPKLLNLALAAEGANLCAVKDELGAIAHSLHEHNATDEANQLFGILESKYTLEQKRDDILACIESATPQILLKALTRSGRHFKEDEEPHPSCGPPRVFSDMDIFAALCNHDTQTAAAKALGTFPPTVSYRITWAAEDSFLAIFKGAFNRRKRSDDEIAAALTKHGTQTAAAEALGISPATVSERLSFYIPEGSDLAAFKGMFTAGKPQKKSDAEIAAALTEHGSQKAAAKALDMSQSRISARIAKATEDSDLYAFKRTSMGRPPKASDDEIAAALIKHGTRKAAAKALGIAQNTISLRITKAKKDSPLAAFKRKRN